MLNEADRSAATRPELVIMDSNYAKLWVYPDRLLRLS